jgi:5'-nucleotidase
VIDEPVLSPGAMAQPGPLVLLSNDDGHASTGIGAMRAALRAAGAEVVLMAPETEQSATSHSLSLHRPMRLRSIAEGVFALDGTPADCIYVALHAGGRVVPRTPDLVVSGINHGMNLGQDAFYSGTIAAAREGALRGIPSLAVSAHPSLDLKPVGALAARIAFELLAESRRAVAAPKAGAAPIGGRRGALVSLNVPERWTGGLRAARLGTRIYEEVVDFRRDPRGREYLWLGGPGVRHQRDPGSDTDAYDDGVASVTRLVLDLTDPDDGALAALATRVMAKPA